MNIVLPPKVIEIISKLYEKGFQVFVVGGAVRDIMMGRPVNDWDLTTDATPEQIIETFPDESFYDNKFGTVGIKNESGRPYEITTFRSEYGYSDARRPDKIVWGKSLEEDIQRRDFTINSMAIRIQANQTASHNVAYISCEGELIDPYDGRTDLKKRLIRAVGDPGKRFNEDALRMMRAVRIASELDFKIEEQTLTAIFANRKLIQKISKERIRDELFKILASSHPYEGMILLKDTGLMQEILPELEATFGVEQKSPGRHHIYDVGTHSLLSLKFCPSTDPIVRFATLIHDVGKVQTFKRLDNGTITFYNHELVSAKAAKKIADRLHFSNEQKDKFYRLVRYHQFTVNENQTDSAIRRFIRNVGKENVADMIDLRVGDRLGGGASQTSWRLEQFKKRIAEVQKQPFTVHDLKINGNDVMKIFGIRPSPKVGRILEKVFDNVVKKEVANKREDLLEHLKRIKDATA